MSSHETLKNQEIWKNSKDTLRATPKFYLADLGLANYLNQKTIQSLKGSEVAIEVKISENVNKQDLKGLIEFQTRHPEARSIVVSQDTMKRNIQINSEKTIEVIPWQEFIKELWAEKIIN